MPATGRTDQLYVQDLHLQAPTLVGPWRLEGTTGGVPFRAVSGTPGPDGRLAAKISGGGDAHPRFEADARFGLVPAESGGSQVEAEGSARLVVGPPTQAAGAYLPFSLAGTFKARGTQVRFEGVDLAIDPGGRTLRLGGTGRLDLRQWRAGLTLEARRLDLDAFLASPEGQNLIARGLPRSAGGLPAMLDLDLAVGSAVLGGEDWSNLALTGTLERAGGLLLRRFSVVGPADSTLSVERAGRDGAPAPHRAGGARRARFGGARPLPAPPRRRGAPHRAPRRAPGRGRRRPVGRHRRACPCATCASPSARPGSPATPATSPPKARRADGSTHRSARAASISPACRPWGRRSAACATTTSP